MFYRGTHGLVDIPPLKDLLPIPCKNTRNFHPKEVSTPDLQYQLLYGNIFPLHCQSMECSPSRHIGPAEHWAKKGESERVGRKAFFSPFLLMPFLFSFGRLLGRIPHNYVSLCVKLSIRNACFLFKSYNDNL